MAFNEKLKKEINDYCNNHLPEEDWYENEFDFIQNESLRNRIIKEFRSIRFAYKLYEGLGASEENLLFEIRSQILAYASIYEAIITYILTTYYSDTLEYDDLTHHIIPVKISISNSSKKLLQSSLCHNGEEVVPMTYRKKEKEERQIRFDDKCDTAVKLGLIHPYIKDGYEINFPEEIKTIYSYRNAIHLLAEQRKSLHYDLEMSITAYKRMQPFVKQIKEKLLADGKIT